MNSQIYSHHSFYSLSSQLKPVGPLVRLDLQMRANRVNEKIHLFHEQKISLKQRNIDQELAASYRVGIYGELGKGTHSDLLSHDLACFLKEQRRDPMAAKSYWAVFYDTADLTDEQFEEKIWQELSYITTANELNRAWDLQFDAKPQEKNISFNLDNETFFVIGMHRNSSCPTRQFHFASLVFTKDEMLYPYQSH